MDDDYAIGVWIIGGLVFLACWAYAVATYGWFIGLGVGWIPALFIGVIAGALWPLVLLVVAGLFLLVWNG